jgi:hypothetical protein
MKALIILLFTIMVNISFGQALVLKGSWNIMVDPEFIKNAGLNYDPNLKLESTPNQTVLSVENNISKVYNGSWHIDVQKINNNWPSQLTLEIRRSNSGKSNNFDNLIGGSIYQNLGNSPQFFFQGKGIVTDINLQYNLKGLSVLIPVDTYTTQILFTLIED